MDGAIRDHASDIREGKLPATCAILLAIPDTYKKIPVAKGQESPVHVPVPSAESNGVEGADVPGNENEQRTGKARKGDGSLLGEKRLVSFGTAEQYLGICERQRQKLIKSGSLKTEGLGQNRKITAESLKAYLPPEIPN
jgi:hypothetical protein